METTRRVTFNNIIFRNIAKIQFPVGVFLTKTGIILLFGWVFSYLITPGKFGLERHTLASLLSHWDGSWYCNIAENSYSGIQSTAFFPFYPLLIRLTHYLLQQPYNVSAVICSNLAFLFTLVFLYHLMVLEQHISVARKAIWLLAAFPTAFFFNVAYSESANLLFIILFFYCLKINRWYLALISGGLATLTHDLGVFLAFSALIYWIKHFKNYSHSTRIIRFLSIGMIPLALCLYMGYLWYHFGSPFTFMAAQSFWFRHFVMPVYNIYQMLHHLHFHRTTDYNFYFVMQMNSWLTLLFLGLCVPLFCDKSITWEQKIFYVLTLLASIISETGNNLQSFSRFILVLFPAYIILAKYIKNENRFTALLLFFFAMQIILIGMFTDGYWIT